jgi:hypothetical protein
MVSVKFNISTLTLKSKALDELERCAIELKARSQELCPVDKGTLRASSQVKRDGDTVYVGYGGAASAYALVQHESLHFHHPVGQAKFLEQPFDEMLPEIIKRLEKAVSGGIL